MRIATVALCLLALIGAATPVQAQTIQIGEISISDDVFDVAELRAAAGHAETPAATTERALVQGQGQQDSWMARNWKWFVPVVVVVAVGGILAASGDGY